MTAIKREEREATNVCQTCGAGYWVAPYRRERSKYCCASCKSAAIAAKHFNVGPKPWAARNLEGHRHKSGSRFEKGHEPWNKGLKGFRVSPETEFKPGRDSEKKLPEGETTIRMDKEGNPRAWVKARGKWKPRAQVVYCAKHGQIPDGCVVHHMDGDTLNDRPGNLVAVTRSQHIAEHRQQLAEARVTPPETPTQEAMDL